MKHDVIASAPGMVNPFPGGMMLRAAHWVLRRRVNHYPSSIPTSAGVDAPILAVRYTARTADSIVPELRRIFDGLIGLPGIDIFVHGSWADSTRTAFSDLDDLIIVHTESIRSPSDRRRLIKQLNRVDMRFCRIDPLQHHGHWLISADSLSAYDESHIPLTVLDESICLHGAPCITGFVLPGITQQGLHRNLTVTLDNIRRLYDRYFKRTITLYEMKSLVSAILLTPAYLFQLNGQRVSKRYAIEHAAVLFGERGLRPIRQCSEIRTHWALALRGTGFRIFRVLSLVLTNPHLYRKLAPTLSPRFPISHFPSISSGDVEVFLEEARAIGKFT